MGDLILKTFISTILPVLATGAGGGLLWLLRLLVQWLTPKAAASKMAKVALQVEHLAEIVVTDLEATMRPLIASAAGDGVLTPDEGAKLKQAAMARLLSLLQENGVAEIKEAFGLFAPQVDIYLSGAIEKAVAALGGSSSSTAVAVATAAPAVPK